MQPSCSSGALLAGIPALRECYPGGDGHWPLAVSLSGRGTRKGTDHELHGEEAVAAAPQAGLCQQAVDPVGDAPIKLQLPLHHLALPIVQEKGALGHGMGRGGHGKSWAAPLWVPALCRNALGARWYYPVGKTDGYRDSNSFWASVPMGRCVSGVLCPALGFSTQEGCEPAGASPK